MRYLIQKLKCWLGFHDLIVSEEEQERLYKAMQNPIAQLCRLDRHYDGAPVVFKICTKCGALR